MAEPGEGVKAPANTVSPDKPVVTGWDMVDTVTVFTPDIGFEERRKLLERRSAVAKPILDKFMADGPEADKPADYFFEKVARYYKKPVSELNEDEIDTAKYNYQVRNAKKDGVVTKFAQTNIPEEDLNEFITLAFAVGKSMAASGEDVNLAIVNNFAYASESVEKGKLYQQLAERWKSRFLTGIDEKETKDRVGVFTSLVTDLSGVSWSPRPPERGIEKTTELFDSISDIYDYIYSNNLNTHEGLVSVLINGAKQAGLDRNDAGQTRRIFQIFKNIEELPDHESAGRFLDTVNHYARSHGLTNEAAEGLQKKLLPAMQAKDPQVDLLVKGGNIWSVKSGDFGAADFICHSYASRITPANINELLVLLHDVPTTNTAKLNQNRSDALGLDSSLRELVHDQRPYVHDLMVAMLSFYETGNREQLVLALKKGRDYEKGMYPMQFDGLTERVFDKDFYEGEITEKVQNQERHVKTVDVLRRLVENTKPIPDSPPQASDPELNKRLQALDASKTGKTASKESLHAVLDYLNGRLAERMQRGEIGIEPNHIFSLAWVDRKSSEVLQNLKFEEQQGAYKQDWFSSILKFQELTASTNAYNEAKFQGFLQQVKGAPSANEAYRFVSRRILENNFRLSRRYKEKGKEDTGFLWSGNTAHELIGLTDYKRPETEQGRKAIEEEEKRRLEPGYHPGD